MMPVVASVDTSMEFTFPLLLPLQVMAVLTTPLSAILGQSTRQVGGFITIAVMGAVGIYLK